jgi:hypothetical protein
MDIRRLSNLPQMADLPNVRDGLEPSSELAAA